MDVDDFRYVCRESEDEDVDFLQSEDDEPGLETADPAPPAAFAAVMYEDWPASTSSDWRPRAHGLHVDPGLVKMGLVRDDPGRTREAHGRAAPARLRTGGVLMERISHECELLAHLFENDRQTLALDPLCDTTELASTAARIVRELGDACGASAGPGDSLEEFHRQLLDTIDTLDLPPVVIERIKRRLTPDAAIRERAADKRAAVPGEASGSGRPRRQRLRSPSDDSGSDSEG